MASSDLHGYSLGSHVPRSLARGARALLPSRGRPDRDVEDFRGSRIPSASKRAGCVPDPGLQGAGGSAHWEADARQGDRVSIYLPMTVDLPVARLAGAALRAVGRGAHALGSRRCEEDGASPSLRTTLTTLTSTQDTRQRARRHVHCIRYKPKATMHTYVHAYVV